MRFDPMRRQVSRGFADEPVAEIVQCGEPTYNLPHARISTYPSVPCTRTRCPSLINLVAFSTPTTAGKPYSRAITAPWVISPPTSVTRPLIDTNTGVQLGSVKAVT